MYPALVRLSTVVALTVPLVASPALALAAPPPASGLHTTTATDLTSDTTPSDDDAVQAPAHDMGEMDGPVDTGETDHADPWGSEHSEHDQPSGEAGEAGDSSDGHTDHTPPPKDRPRVQLLSAFGGLNGAVLVSAALVRRHDRKHPRHRPRASAAPTAADRRRTSR